jgi:arylformamidase
MTVCPTKKDSGDFVVEKSQIEGKLEKGRCEALILRTLPNDNSKKEKQYSGTNPPYMDIALIPLLEEAGVKHLLVDLPSVDREEDGGKLAFHHAFWQVPENPQLDKTITELIYVDESIKDGRYILNLQVAPFENDAAPSRPVLHGFF